MLDLNAVKDIDKEIQQRTSRMNAICSQMAAVGQTPSAMRQLQIEHEMLAEEINKLFAYANEHNWEFGDDGSKPLEPALSLTDFFGTPWAEGAEFGVTVRYHTWPVGWDRNLNKRFFNDELLMERDIQALRDWAQSEDNKVEVSVYRLTDKIELVSANIYG